MDDRRNKLAIWQNYVFHAHTLGLTVAAIRDDFRNHKFIHIAKKELIGFLLSNNIHPRHSYVWNTYTLRFIIHCKERRERTYIIHNKLLWRGFEVDDSNDIDDIADKRVLMEALMKESKGNEYSPDFAIAVSMAHELGYTISETNSLMQLLGRGKESFLGEFNMRIEGVLLENDVAEISQRRGRDWTSQAENYVKAAFDLGLPEDQIWFNVHTFGYDLKLPEIRHCLAKLQFNALEQLHNELMNDKQ